MKNRWSRGLLVSHPCGIRFCLFVEPSAMLSRLVLHGAAICLPPDCIPPSASAKAPTHLTSWLANSQATKRMLLTGYLVRQCSPHLFITVCSGALALEIRPVRSCCRAQDEASIQQRERISLQLLACLFSINNSRVPVAKSQRQIHRPSICI